jgi:hypothetical protein
VNLLEDEGIELVGAYAMLGDGSAGRYQQSPAADQVLGR